MDDNNLEPSSIERSTLIHWKLVLVYISYTYPIGFFKLKYFSVWEKYLQKCLPPWLR